MRFGRLSQDQRVSLALFALALTVRLAFIATGTVDNQRISDDAKAYDDLAKNLVTRHQFVTTADPPHRLDVPSVARPPLTPFVLAGAYLLFGGRLFVAQVVLAVLGGLTSVGVFLLGRRLFPTPVGVLAGMMTGVYPFFVFLAAVPLTENLAICLYTFFALSLVSLAAKCTVRGIVVAGVLFGLAALNRPQVLGLVVLLPVWAWSAFPGRGWRSATVLGGVMAIAMAVIAPWTARNYAAVGHWIPITVQGGIALYAANNPYAGTALTRLELGAFGWRSDNRSAEALGSGSTVELDRRAYRLAFSFIKHHPAEFLRLTLRRMRIFWSAYDHPIHRLTWYPVMLLASVGLWWTRSRWRELMPLYLLIIETIAIGAIFSTLPRYRTPIEPFLLLFTAAALCRMWELLPSTRLRESIA
jgi:4-amino-4-deoxy-L-arabinose transferase-like glycosyltransferase